MTKLDTILNILANLLSIIVLLGVGRVIQIIFEPTYSVPLTWFGKIQLSTRQKHTLDVLWREAKFLNKDPWSVQHAKYARRKESDMASRHLIEDAEMSRGFEELSAMKVVTNNSKYGVEVFGFGPNAKRYVKL